MLIKCLAQYMQETVGEGGGAVGGSGAHFPLQMSCHTFCVHPFSFFLSLYGPMIFKVVFIIRTYQEMILSVCSIKGLFH